MTKIVESIVEPHFQTSTMRCRRPTDDARLFNHGLKNVFTNNNFGGLFHENTNMMNIKRKKNSELTIYFVYKI